jgi:hypothetical protein
MKAATWCDLSKENGPVRSDGEIVLRGTERERNKAVAGTTSRRRHGRHSTRSDGDVGSTAPRTNSTTASIRGATCTQRIVGRQSGRPAEGIDADMRTSARARLGRLQKPSALPRLQTRTSKRSLPLGIGDS